MFDTPQGRSIMQRLGLPEGLTCVGALSLGYIDKQPAAPKPRKANYYRVVK